MINFQRRLQAKRALQKKTIKEHWKEGEFEDMMKKIHKKAKKNPHTEDEPFT